MNRSHNSMVDNHDSKTFYDTPTRIQSNCRELPVIDLQLPLGGELLV